MLRAVRAGRRGGVYRLCRPGRHGPPGGYRAGGGVLSVRRGREFIRQHRTIAASAFAGYFSPIHRFEKLEIHKVFLRFSNLGPTKNLSPNALAELCGAAYIPAAFSAAGDFYVGHCRGADSRARRSTYDLHRLPVKTYKPIASVAVVSVSRATGIQRCTDMVHNSQPCDISVNKFAAFGFALRDSEVPKADGEGVSVGAWAKFNVLVDHGLAEIDLPFVYRAVI